MFFRGEAGRRSGTVNTPPVAVVVSQGIDQAGDHHRTSFAEWGTVEKLDDHVVLYVAKGTHRFYFHPVTDQTTDPHDNPNPGGDPGPHDDDRHEGGISDLLIVALILLALAALVLVIFGLVIGAIIAAIVLIFLALWAFFEWLASLFASGSNDDSGDPVPGTQGNDEANDSGTQTGGGGDPPAGPAPSDGGGPGGGGGEYGSPNTGSPTGQATVSFDVRLVDRVFHDDERPTGYPSETPCESPTWWDYSGGWGIKVLERLRLRLGKRHPPHRRARPLLGLLERPAVEHRGQRRKPGGLSRFAGRLPPRTVWGVPLSRPQLARSASTLVTRIQSRYLAVTMFRPTTRFMVRTKRSSSRP